jgi:hypothetical protein
MSKCIATNDNWQRKTRFCSGSFSIAVPLARIEPGRLRLAATAVTMRATGFAAACSLETAKVPSLFRPYAEPAIQLESSQPRPPTNWLRGFFIA